jgi:hypothetical protein
MTEIATYSKSATDPALQSGRRKLFWDERESPPAVDSPRFLLRVMEMGNWQMARAMERTFSRDYLIGVLRNAPCGALSRKSWNFWCLRLGVDFEYPDRFATRI